MRLTRLALALFALFGVLLAPLAARAELKVVATVPTLAAVAAAVGGNDLEISTLALPTQDPHFVDAKPSLALQLSRADLLLVVGLGLEAGWLPPLQLGARNSAIQAGAPGYLDCSQLVPLLEIPASVDRSQGDIHAGGNPHYLYDPRAVSAVAKAIAERMAKLDPNHAAGYRQRADQFRNAVAVLSSTIAKRFEPRRGTPIIGYHKSWAYLADWLGLEPVDFLEPKPGIPPNPGHVAKVLATARARQVPIIIQERFYPSATGRLVAEKSGARLVLLAGGADFNAGQSYLDHLTELAAQIERGLER